MGRICLDLLAQAINMRPDRVGCRLGAIAPHVAHDAPVSNRPVAMQVEIFEECGFFCREGSLAAGLVLHQPAMAAIERVLPDRKHHVFRSLELPQMREQQRKLARRCDEIVGARVESEDLFGLGTAGAQHDNRRREPALAQDPAQLRPVRVGQQHRDEHHVERHAFDKVERLGTGADCFDFRFKVTGEVLGEGNGGAGVAVNDEDPPACWSVLNLM